MKLVNVELECQIVLNHEKTTEWIIESPVLFAGFVQQLINQMAGEEGKFVLSDSEEELDLAKYAEIIINPFSVDFNDRRIQKKLYAELQKIANGEELYLATQEMMNCLDSYFLQLENISGYELETAREMDMLTLFKAKGLQLECYAADFFEKLVQYMKIVVELLQKKLIVFVNLRSYLNDSQISALCEMAVYNEIALLLIENIQRDFSEQRKYYIIDKDGCEIL